MPRVAADGGSVFRGAFSRIVDWIFGFDFFLSYSHSDGKGYPGHLKEALERAGFRTFLDQTDYVAGVDLRRETRRQVHKSRKFVVIGRSMALQSPWVMREVEAALLDEKTPLIVNVNRAVESAAAEAALAKMALERDWLRLDEEIVQTDGSPSHHVVNELIRSFDATRQEVFRRRVLAAVAVILGLIAAFAGYQWFVAEEAKTALEAKVQELSAANIRLSAKTKLRIAPSESSQVIDEDWYRIATDHTRAIVIVSTNRPPWTRTPDQFQSIGTGVVIRASELSSSWEDQAVLLTALHVVKSFDGTIEPSAYRGVFPGIDENQFIEFGAVLWQSPEYDIAVLSIETELPFGAIPITRLSRLDILSIDIDRTTVLRTLMIPSFVASGESTGFQLAINRLVRRVAPSRQGPVRLIYSYATGPGASGAPVFDANTGELLCLHQRGIPGPLQTVDEPRSLGECTWLGNIGDAIVAGHQRSTGP